jgi:aspartyl-tRNA synthetase
LSFVIAAVELANGYHELVDTEVSLQRAMDNKLRPRLADGKKELPENSRLAEAMRSGIQMGAGVAAGVDRWVMLKLVGQSIREVRSPFLSIEPDACVRKMAEAGRNRECAEDAQRMPGLAARKSALVGGLPTSL